MYDYASIVPVASFALLPFSALYVIITTSIIRRRLGSSVESFVPRFHYQFCGVLFLSPALIALAWYRGFISLPLFALCAVGVIGFFIAFRELYISRMTGVYENGVLWSSGHVYFDDLDSLVQVDAFTLNFVDLDGHERIFSVGDESLVTRMYERVKKAVPTLK